MREKLRKTAIGIIGDVPWGTHFCQFYQSKEDLIEILVPYFEQGLENNEFCMWVTAEPLGVEDAKTALKEKVKNLDDYIRKGQIEILDYNQWYTATGRFEADKVLEGWMEKEKQAIEKGFDGLRLTGNTFWLKKKDWQSFADYEAVVNSVIGKHRMLAICSYSLDRCRAGQVIDVVNNHQFALIRKEGKWTTLEPSDRKRMEESLRDSEGRFRVIFDNANDGILLADEETKKFYTGNNTICQMLGYSLEETKNLGVTDIHPKEDLPYVIEQFKKQSRREIALAKDIPMKRKDGSVFYADVNSSLITLAGRKCLIGVFRDITERKKAEEEMDSMNRKLQATVEELTQSNKELEEFVHIASHDLKTPLRGITTLAEWLSTDYADKLGEQGKEQMKLLLGRADRMQKLIDGILQYSRIGRVKENLAVINLNKLIPEIIDTLAPPANISVTVENELPTIESEPTRIAQVFQNLMSNAINYMDKPQGQIKIGCVEENGFWKFNVTDNGPGIGEKYFEKIFQIFQTLALRDDFKSTGIGLAIAKKIVGLYGGRVWVESKPEEGSTFFFTLPKQETRPGEVPGRSQMGVKNEKLKTNIACGR